MDNKTPFFTLRRLFRWLLYCITALALFSISAIISAPYLAKYYLRDWMLDNGADTASVGKITINPFTGRLTMQGLDIKQDGKTPAAGFDHGESQPTHVTPAHATPAQAGIQ